MCHAVALFTRAWIEIASIPGDVNCNTVALFTRAWIEIRNGMKVLCIDLGRPLYEGVD